MKRIIRKELRNKGITLIALVITVVVLLILAGITIAVISGNNGILQNATNAKQENSKATEKEILNIALNEWQIEKNTGTLTLEDFLKDKFGENNVIQDSNTQNYIVTIEKYIGEIDNEGNLINFEEKTVTSDEDTLIGEAINAEKYGYKVIGYNVQEKEMKTDVWRLFYQDKNYTYLITDECVGSYQPINYIQDYLDASYVSIVGQKLSPMLLKLESYFNDSNKNDNIRATAWLTDTEKWEEFKNEDAVFAIGSPTIELYVASYNATANVNNRDNIYIFAYDNSYDYDLDNRIETECNNGIYTKSSDVICCWIASPGLNNKKLFSMPTNNGNYGQSGIAISGAVRPIVCMPTSIFEEKYKLSNE